MKTMQLSYSALFLALGLVLPFFTAQIPEIGSMLLPMHIPVLLSGFLLGPSCGLIVGVITPLLRSMLFGMPPILTAIIMAFELGAYGFLAGYFYQIKTKHIYLSLLLSMLLGRVVWGMASMFLLGVYGDGFTFTLFLMNGFVNASLGIVLQLVLIPMIVKNVSIKKD